MWASENGGHVCIDMVVWMNLWSVLSGFDILYCDFILNCIYVFSMAKCYSDGMYCDVNKPIILDLGFVFLEPATKWSSSSSSSLCTSPGGRGARVLGGTSCTELLCCACCCGCWSFLMYWLDVELVLDVFDVGCCCFYVVGEYFIAVHFILTYQVEDFAFF